MPRTYRYSYCTSPASYIILGYHALARVICSHQVPGRSKSYEKGVVFKVSIIYLESKTRIRRWCGVVMIIKIKRYERVSDNN